MLCKWLNVKWEFECYANGLRETLSWLSHSNAFKLVRTAFWPTIRTPFLSVWYQIGDTPLRCSHKRPHLKQDFSTVLWFMSSCVFGLLFWFDLWICSFNDLSCICSDFSFFCRFSGRNTESFLGGGSTKKCDHD